MPTNRNCHYILDNTKKDPPVDYWLVQEFYEFGDRMLFSAFLTVYRLDFPFDNSQSNSIPLIQGKISRLAQLRVPPVTVD